MVKEILLEMIYIFTNYFVCNIPFWPVRRALYRLLGMKIGKGSRILMKTIVISPWKISIGSHSYINEMCFLDGRGKIEIGSNVTIAVYTHLLTGYHDIHDDYFSYRVSHITIGDNAVLFAGSTCLPGVDIEEGAIFTAGSVIKRGRYKCKGIWGGNPIQYIGERKSNAEYIQNAWTPILR